VPFVITPHGGDIEKNDKGLIINSKITDRIKKTFASTQAITAISSDMKNRILQLSAVPDKVYIIPNGVSIDDFQVNQVFLEKNPDDEPYILYLGGLRKIKGVDILLRAFSIIKKDFPRLKLKIAGDGKEINNLKALSVELGISEHIDFLGIVQGVHKIKLLQNAVFLACPSRYESFGIVILEAFASGIPVIASKVGGMPDIINDGENGFLVEPENPQQLAKKIKIMFSNNALRNKMAQNALPSAQHYNWYSIVKKYIDIYLKVRERL
jgi:glycosyltransferase involved in cell wall biosynthesis